MVGEAPLHAAAEVRWAERHLPLNDNDDDAAPTEFEKTTARPPSRAPVQGRNRNRFGVAAATEEFVDKGHRRPFVATTFFDQSKMLKVQGF
ncbi:MAG: hypothetical protein WC563_00010 [Brevundimonas sp.]